MNKKLFSFLSFAKNLFINKNRSQENNLISSKKQEYSLSSYNMLDKTQLFFLKNFIDENKIEDKHKFFTMNFISKTRTNILGPSFRVKSLELTINKNFKFSWDSNKTHQIIKILLKNNLVDKEEVKKINFINELGIYLFDLYFQKSTQQEKNFIYKIIDEYFPNIKFEIDFKILRDSTKNFFINTMIKIKSLNDVKYHQKIEDYFKKLRSNINYIIYIKNESLKLMLNRWERWLITKPEIIIDEQNNKKIKIIEYLDFHELENIMYQVFNLKKAIKVNF